MKEYLPDNIELLVDLFPYGSRPVHESYPCHINEKEDYRTTLRNYDSAETVFYCDPPNITKNTVYYPELMTALGTVKGKFVLRHPHHTFANDTDFYKYDTPEEMIITNYKCGNGLTPEKRKIAKTVMDITPEEAQNDLQQFMDATVFARMSRLGLTFLNYFFLPYRLDTKTKGKSYYDFYKSDQRANWMKEFAKKHSYYEAYKLGYGLSQSFRPSVAWDMYQLLKPTSIIDPSAGWGGRALASAKYGCKYTGFDTNTDLREPYQAMIKELGERGKNIAVEFKDSAKVDYSKYTYDMVFTSPPYYTEEKYQNMPTYDSYDDWLHRFLTPVVENTYKYLNNSGHFCMNVSPEIYEDLKKIMGRSPDKKILLPKTQRRKDLEKAHKEYIYIWRK
jgi:site-specific DNA-adenine methylase